MRGRLLGAAVAASLILLAAPAQAGPEDDAAETAETLLDSLFRTTPAKPGFSHTLCQGTTGGNCVEGAVLTDDVDCQPEPTVPCTATNCGGEGSAYRCVIKYWYRVCLTGIAINPKNVTELPLLVNVEGHAEGIPNIEITGIAYECSKKGPYQKEYPNIPVHGMDVTIPAYIRIAVGPAPGLYPEEKAWETAVIHLPPPRATALLRTENLMQDAVGTIAGAAEEIDSELVNYAQSYQNWDPTPATVRVGPEPVVPDPPPVDTRRIEQLARRVIIMIQLELLGPDEPIIEY